MANRQQVQEVVNAGLQSFMSDVEKQFSSPITIRNMREKARVLAERAHFTVEELTA